MHRASVCENPPHMTDTTGRHAAESGVTGSLRPERKPPPEATEWVSWIFFAAAIMVLVGAFHAIAGLVAIFDDDYYDVGRNDLVVHVSYGAWGWTHLVAGSVVVAAGIFLLAGHVWARVVAVILTALSAVLNIAFLSASPVWSAIIIGLDVIVIYAICVHGDEVNDPLLVRR